MGVIGFTGCLKFQFKVNGYREYLFTGLLIN